MGFSYCNLAHIIGWALQPGVGHSLLKCHKTFLSTESSRASSCTACRAEHLPGKPYKAGELCCQRIVCPLHTGLPLVEGLVDPVLLKPVRPCAACLDRACSQRLLTASTVLLAQSP